MADRTYGIVPKGALEKLDSRLCGSEDYRKDAPYCKESREEINLNEYKQNKYWDYVYRTPIQVQFCSDFNDWYNNLNEDGNSCAAVTSYTEDASDLETLIEGRRNEMASKMVLKSENDLFEELINALPPNQRRAAGVRERIRAKAMELHDEMVKSREEAGKELAFLDQKLSSRINAGTKMCADIEPRVLKRIALDCRNLLDEHKEIIDTRETWKNRLLGIATAGLYFILDGRYRRGKEAFKAAWKESKDAGDGFFTRFLKAIEAGYAASKPGAVDSTADYYPTPESIPENGEPPELEAGEAEETQVNSTDGDATQVDEAAKKEQVYRIKPGNDLAKLADESEKLLLSILELGKSAAGSDRTAVKVIESALQMSYASDQEKFQSLIPVLKSDATLHMIEIAGANLDQAFYDEFIPSASSALTEASELFKAGRNEEARALLSSLKEALGPIDEKNKNFSWTLNRMRSIEESAEKILILPEEKSAFRKELLTRLRAMNHDVGNNAAAIGSILTLVDTPEVFMNFMESSKISFNHSELGSIVRAAATMNKADAARRGVDIKIASSIAKLPVPKSVRRDLYRVLFEAIQNGVKYSDPEKSDRSIYVGVRRDKESLVFTIKDNGVGMSEEQSKLIQEQPGFRFRPELASGTGNGVRGTILGLSGKNGWEVTYRPRPGEGTTVIIKVETSDWEVGSSDGSGPGGGTSGPGGRKICTEATVEEKEPGEGSTLMSEADRDELLYGKTGKTQKKQAGNALQQSTMIFLGNPALTK